MNPEEIFKNLKKKKRCNNSIQINSQSISLDLSYSCISKETFQEFEFYSKQLNLTKIFKSCFDNNALNIFEKKSVNHHQ